MMRENLKTQSSEYIGIYQDDQTLHHKHLKKFRININPDSSLRGKYPHDPGGTMICQLRKYIEQLYVNITILLNQMHDIRCFFQTLPN